jgi:hypothetical protein
MAAAKAGFQTCIHAIGDRANRIVLDVFERVQCEVPGARDLRMRNEHTQILDFSRDHLAVPPLFLDDCTDDA